MLKRLKLILGHLTLRITYEVDLILREVDHFTDNSIEQSTFSRCYFPDYHDELPLSHLQVDVFQIDYLIERSLHFVVLILFRTIDFILRLIFVFLAKRGRNAPAKVTLDVKGAIRVTFLGAPLRELVVFD